MASPVSYTEVNAQGEVFVLAHGTYFAEEVSDGVWIRETPGMAEIDATGVWILHPVTVTPPDDPDAEAERGLGHLSEAFKGEGDSEAIVVLRYPSESGILPGLRSDASTLFDGSDAARTRFGSESHVEQRG